MWPLSLNFGWNATDQRPCSTNPVCTSDPSGFVFVRSRNGSGRTRPSLVTTLMRPTRSTTKMRPVPSRADVTPTGSLKPSATRTSASAGTPGTVPPGRAT